ncbi:MAG: hypothetical protein F6K56_04190 [Moorea sp. SIO3G5]|nr:hypothetical protein [Moorena sp. SIO3G5]
MVATKDSKDQIFQAFEQILKERQNIDSKIATKEEEAEKAKNQQVLETASNYTVDNIVKGMADLQLEFGTIVNELSEKLSSEASKLDELKLAIKVETEHLQYLQQIRVVADALHLLNQEHQEKLKSLDQKADQQREEIEKDQDQKRKLWQKDQEDFEIARQEQNELLVRERQRQEADYQYELERNRKIETDQYEELSRNQERELQEANQEKEKQWSEREQKLQESQALFEEYQQKVEAFPGELDEIVKKVKDKAIKKVQNDAKVQADLLTKGWEVTQQGYDVKIQSLEQHIEKQNKQIENLYSQLQETLKQSQALTLKAFDGSSRSKDQN